MLHTKCATERGNTMNNDVGIFKLPNGNWAYRITYTRNGKRHSKRNSKDELGNPFIYKRDAVKARKKALMYLEDFSHPKAPTRKTFEEVFDEYCQNGRKDKAQQTIRRQDSLWKNHLKAKFGECLVDEIAVADVQDYLAKLYYDENYSYRYVEGFLKQFYLIFGQAYSRNYLSVEKYDKLCRNKDTRIKMPKRKDADDFDVVTFSDKQLQLLDDYFKETNSETAYLLGRYCGLRINECYGLKWENVNLDEGTIRIDRQMEYLNGVKKLKLPKTHNSKRTIYLCDYLKNYLSELYSKREKAIIELADVRTQKTTFVTDIDGKQIPSTDFVNTLLDGTIRTVNSMKYHTQRIKELYGIKFKYHYLRHTYGTKMAEKNTPQHLLCNQMGHARIQVTQQYYLAISDDGVRILRENLNHL